MAQANYNQVISKIKTLDLPDQLRLLEDMATIIRKKARQVKPRSILEIKGKGKNIWKEVNIKSYIDQERSSWNG
jgi:DNA-binding HxlR family transcriptional regulator